MKAPGKPVGLTKDGSWQFGLRKTFPFPQQFVWDFMFSDQGLRIWLGELEDELEFGKTFQTTEGVEGLVRVLEPYAHIRMKWKKQHWENSSTVQVRIMGNEQRATISFLQEKLADHAQREEMKRYWNQKMTQIENGLAAT